MFEHGEKTVAAEHEKSSNFKFVDAPVGGSDAQNRVTASIERTEFPDLQLISTPAGALAAKEHLLKAQLEHDTADLLRSCNFSVEQYMNTTAPDNPIFLETEYGMDIIDRARPSLEKS